MQKSIELLSKELNLFLESQIEWLRGLRHIAQRIRMNNYFHLFLSHWSIGGIKKEGKYFAYTLCTCTHERGGENNLVYPWSGTHYVGVLTWCMCMYPYFFAQKLHQQNSILTKMLQDLIQSLILIIFPILFS